MLIKQPSLIREYTLIYSGDPALSLPTDEVEAERVLGIARETGDWSSLLLAGQLPTMFQVVPLVGTALDYYVGEANRKRLTVDEGAALALRIAIQRVDNFGENKVEHEIDIAHGQKLATKSIIDKIYAETGEHGRRIVQELGGYILSRAKEQLRPK